MNRIIRLVCLVLSVVFSVGVMPGCFVDNLNGVLARNEAQDRAKTAELNNRINAEHQVTLGRWVELGNLAIACDSQTPRVITQVDGGDEGVVEGKANVKFVYHCVSPNHSQIRRVQGYHNALELRAQGWQCDPVLVPVTASNPMNGAFTVTVVYEDRGIPWADDANRHRSLRCADRTMLQTTERYVRRNSSY